MLFIKLDGSVYRVRDLGGGWLMWGFRWELVFGRVYGGGEMGKGVFAILSKRWMFQGDSSKIYVFIRI